MKHPICFHYMIFCRTFFFLIFIYQFSFPFLFFNFLSNFFYASRFYYLLKSINDLCIIEFVGVVGTFSSITGMQFSPTKPGVFAAGSTEGLLYLFDITSPTSTPVVVLEVPTGCDGVTAQGQNQSQGQGQKMSRGIHTSFNCRIPKNIYCIFSL